MALQIDVIEANDETGIVTCIFSTGERDVRIYMSYNDYENLIQDKFFIRDGTWRDSANVLNTTKRYAITGGWLSHDEIPIGK